MIETLKSVLVNFLNKFIPKNQNQILFDSLPDFSDNAKAFYEYIQNNNPESNLNPVWVISDHQLLETLSANGIPAYDKHSFSGFYQFFRSKYIFTTNNTFLEFKSSRQVLVNLWHGMPLKTMGYAEDSKNPHIPHRSHDDNYILISTSNLMKNVLSSCFYIDARKVHVTGQPRNDRIFSKKKGIENLTRLIEQENLLDKEVKDYQKIVLFTPTWRNWDGKVDGTLKPDLMNLDDYHDQKFKEYTRENKILFIVKLHPFEEAHYSQIIADKEDMVLITSKMLQDNLMDLYDIIGGVDILVTDYSSIYFDFLLLDRPIIFIPTDLAEYEKSRGFLFDPYDFWAPGPKVLKFPEFLRELTQCLEDENYYQNERKIVNDIVNKYHDSNSSERLYNLVFHQFK
ncbi:MAG: CDP-glycerol glycerophosphotransferase family protein [Methanobacterium sp.]